MKYLYRFLGIFSAIPFRMIAQWELVLAAIFGLVASLSLILSIPLYADAVYYRALQKTVVENSEYGFKAHPPFSFLFRYYGGWHGNLKWEDIQAVDEYLTNSVTSTLNLPQLEVVRFFSSDNYPIIPKDGSTFSTGKKTVRASLGLMNDLGDHIRIIDGQFPSPENQSSYPLDVLISSKLAEEAGFKVGDTYRYVATEGWFFYVESGGWLFEKGLLGEFPIRIAGIWEPIDPAENYWILEPENYDNVMFVTQESFSVGANQVIPGVIFSAQWYFLVDGTKIYSGDVIPLLQRIRRLERTASQKLPNLGMPVSPVEALTAYHRSADLLTILLYAFSVPIIGLILAFIGLVSRLTVERQRNEIAVMRSRGASSLQVLSFTIFEGLLLGIIALLISLPVATKLSGWIGQTRSFMDLSSTNDLRVGVSSEVLTIGLVALVLVLIAILVPAINAARHTIVSYKSAVGKTSTRSWWQRIWLDALILIPAAYGYYMLKQQGRIVVFGSEGNADPFQNPLLFLVPALGIFALTLFSLRFIQPIMSVIAKLTGMSRNASLTLAARQLSRSPNNYYTPLIILILTVSLSSYTGSLAYTFDQHLYDQTYYKLGADIRLLDVGDPRQLRAVIGQGASSGGVWEFIPVTEYYKIEGVESAARLGQYTARASVGNKSKEGLFFGIDRLDFPRVVFWRDDFGPESLGGLMNRLASDRAGVLVPRSYLRENGLKIGDSVHLRVNTFGQNNDLDVNIVGSFNYFPMWYPEQGPLFVGNLSYFFRQVRNEYPYRVLLALKDGVDPVALGKAGMPGLAANVQYISWDTPVTEITATQAQPERQGLFGFLLIGFGAAALLSALAFLLYVLFSFRQRFIELGVLRAAGLSMRQMSGYMAWELTFLILLGISIGTGFGVLASKLFIPYLQIGPRMSSLIPPFMVLIAWPTIFQIYWMFAALFGVTLVVLLLVLRKMRIFQAIKLGETI